MRGENVVVALDAASSQRTMAALSLDAILAESDEELDFADAPSLDDILNETEASETVSTAPTATVSPPPSSRVPPTSIVGVLVANAAPATMAQPTDSFGSQSFASAITEPKAPQNVRLWMMCQRGRLSWAGPWAHCHRLCRSS